MIFYTIYTSIPTKKVTKEEIDTITQESIKWNSVHGITGILLCLEDRFFQFLEGEEKDVLEVFEMIKKDPRHKDVNVRIRGFENHRVFHEWSMGSWMLSNEQLTQLTALEDLREFLKDPTNTSLQSRRLIIMMENILRTWIEHEPERVKRLKGDQ